MNVTVDGGAVANDVSRRYFPNIGLGELERNQFNRWVRSHSQPQDPAATVLQNQQPVEQRNEIVGTTNRPIDAMPSA
jgi:hypothetical protein